MKNMKKWSALVIAFSMLITMLAGCGGDKPGDSSVSSSSEVSANNTADASKPKEVRTLNVWYASMWPWVKTSAQWDDSENCKQIEQESGIRLNYDMQVGNQDDLLGPMIASGSLPDSFVIAPYSSPYVQQIIDAGMAYSISDMMEKYEPEAAKKIPASQFQFHTSADGKLYKYVGFEYTAEAAQSLGEVGVAPTKGEQLMWVRKDILQAWGKDDIKTIDEFADYLRFVKKNYPDVTPLSGSEQYYLLNSFGLQPLGSGQSRYYVDESGKVQLFVKDPKYLEYAKWINGLFREGIISANTLTMQEQQRREQLANGLFGAITGGYYDIMNNINSGLTKAGNKIQYTAVGPIDKTPGSFKFTLLRTRGDLAWMVNSKIEDPSIPARWLAYMLSDEGQQHAMGGIKGKNFTVDSNGKYELAAANKIALNTNLEEYCKTYSVVSKFIPWVNLKYWTYFVDGPMTQDAAKQVNQTRFPLDRIIDTWAEGFADLDGAVKPDSDAGVAMTKCKEATDDLIVKLIVAKSDAEFQQIYDKGIKDMETMGMVKYEDAVNAEHQKQLKELGK